MGGGAVCYNHFSAFSGLKFRNPIFSFNELADRDSVFISRRELLNLAVSSTRADGNPVPGRAPKGEWKKNSESMETEKKTSNKEEILALFKRIQSSISKGETIKSRNRNSKQAEDVSAESLLEVLHQSTRKGKTARKQGNKLVASGKGLQKKEQKAEYSSEKDARSSRPPSNFTKRSPIPSPSSPRNKVDLKSEVLPTMDVDTEIISKKFEGMKLVELKEVAKSKGIRGYSKLKKGELVELLKRS
ncbi:SAP-like protein BP-73 [Olea europaea var. sylvestris]|uniref:SAP-like protein BP-73 n=1 Tax=Olea europaea var. sylvestris TaxID=158386 RepID=UPI000C1D542C|nr:SAP-like protein BP-73 [Olea europaea var. sylvestris]